MEKRIDALFDMVEELTMEMRNVKAEIVNMKTEMKSGIDDINKRLDDRLDTHQHILGKLSYQDIVFEGKVAELQEKIKKP